VRWLPIQGELGLNLQASGYGSDQTPAEAGHLISALGHGTNPLRGKDAGLEVVGFSMMSAKIAVLPFRNLSGDPGQAYLAEGI
jgi:hypothetical protein